MEFLHFRGKKPPVFAHESERELAELLDENGLPWEYEPHTFPLEHDENGRLVEAMTPDFYLPEAGIYIECTEMNPSRAHRKRRKLRKLRKQYGEVVTYVDRRDFARLRAKYLAKKQEGAGTPLAGERRSADLADDEAALR
ncbi:MAG TPA: hypothetical protein VI142_06650 [Gaiellaceae bacterium]